MGSRESPAEVLRTFQSAQSASFPVLEPCGAEQTQPGWREARKVFLLVVLVTQGGPRVRGIAASRMNVPWATRLVPSRHVRWKG